MNLWQSFLSWFGFNSPKNSIFDRDAIKEWVLLEIAGTLFKNYGDLVEIDNAEEFSELGMGIGEIIDLVLASEEYFEIEIPDRYIMQMKKIEDFIELIYIIKTR